MVVAVVAVAAPGRVKTTHKHTHTHIHNRALVEADSWLEIEETAKRNLAITQCSTKRPRHSRCKWRKRREAGCSAARLQCGLSSFSFPGSILPWKLTIPLAGRGVGCVVELLEVVMSGRRRQNTHIDNVSWSRQ